MSSNRRFILIAYDVSNDRRRARLHNRLLAFGTPVQYSVFECMLTPRDYNRLQTAVAAVIRPRLDRVRYYQLCPRCASRTRATSGPEPFDDSDSLIV